MQVLNLGSRVVEPGFQNLGFQTPGTSLNPASNPGSNPGLNPRFEPRLNLGSNPGFLPKLNLGSEPGFLGCCCSRAPPPGQPPRIVWSSQVFRIFRQFREVRTIARPRRDHHSKNSVCVGISFLYVLLQKFFKVGFDSSSNMCASVLEKCCLFEI